MNFSAASSRSLVVTPSRTLPSTSCSARTRIDPAAAILSISSGDFLMIIAIRGSQLVLEAKRRDRCPEVVVDLGGRALAVESLEDPAVLVVVDEGRRLLVVDREAVAHDILGVVLALNQARTVLVARLVVLGRIGEDVVDVAVLLAHAAPGDPLDDLLVGHVDQQRRR